MSDERVFDLSHINKPYEEVSKYLKKIKRHASQGDFKISEREDKNLPFMRVYNLAGNKKKCAEMICSLEPTDYVHTVSSRMKGNEGQELFVFCRKHALYKLMANSADEIWVYYKFDVVSDSFTVVVSFHGAEHEPEFPFQ